jgi:hypothetical protein
LPGLFFLAGFIAGITISIRFQAIIYWGGMGLALLIQKKWLQTIIFGLGGGVLHFIIIQGPIDYIIWGKTIRCF